MLGSPGSERSDRSDGRQRWGEDVSDECHAEPIELGDLLDPGAGEVHEGGAQLLALGFGEVGQR